MEHMGIKVQLMGQIELFSERGTIHEFMGMGECCRHWIAFMGVRGNSDASSSRIPVIQIRLHKSVRLSDSKSALNKVVPSSLIICCMIGKIVGTALYLEVTWDVLGPQ